MANPLAADRPIPPTVVSNGLFMVNLDFGSGIFTGPARWLDMGVRTNGNTNAFTILTPRQLLTPAPYAIFANSASNLVGSLAATQLNGTLPQSAFAGYTNTSGVDQRRQFFWRLIWGTSRFFNGTFVGNGGGLTNLNASNLAGGTVADARLSSNVPLLNTNQTFTGSNTFTGINAFTNFGNTFKGSFFGNGLVGWIPTNGTAVQAVFDTGYLLTNSQLVTVTLPASPSSRRHRADLRRWRERLADCAECRSIHHRKFFELRQIVLDAKCRVSAKLAFDCFVLGWQPLGGGDQRQQWRGNLHLD